MQRWRFYVFDPTFAERDMRDQGVLAKPGDLVVVFGDTIKRTWKQIIYFSSERGSEENTKTSTFKLNK